MPSLRFAVPVAASAGEVTTRLDAAGDHPRELVSWFTSDPGVEAAVRRGPDGWRVRVAGSAFTAEVDVSVAPADGTGSLVSVDGQLAGRGLLRIAGPALGLAAPRIEAEARRTLQREFGAR